MKKMIAFVLTLASIFALCACGETAAAEKKDGGGNAELPAETQVVPEDDFKYRELAEALDAGDCDAALALVDALEPEPVLPPFEEVEITTENFPDYFEYVELPENNIWTENDAEGNLMALHFRSGYYLKDGYTILAEKAADCRLDVGLLFELLWVRDGEAIETDFENGTYKVTGNLPEGMLSDMMLSGQYANNRQDAAPFYYVYVAETRLAKEDNNSCLIPEENIELVSASGTLFFASGAAAENDAEEHTELPEIPEQYIGYEELIYLLEDGKYGEARAYIENLRPAPPVLEVEITADNFLEYFEFVELPENSISVQRYSSGEPAAMFAGSGFYLRDGVQLHPNHKYNNDITADVKYNRYLVESDCMDIDFEKHTYELRYPLEDCTNYILEEEETQHAVYNEPYLCIKLRYRTSILNDYSNYAAVVMGDIEVLSASGTLYLVG